MKPIAIAIGAVALRRMNRPYKKDQMIAVRRRGKEQKRNITCI